VIDSMQISLSLTANDPQNTNPSPALTLMYTALPAGATVSAQSGAK